MRKGSRSSSIHVDGANLTPTLRCRTHLNDDELRSNHVAHWASKLPMVDGRCPHSHQSKPGKSCRVTHPVTQLPRLAQLELCVPQSPQVGPSAGGPGHGAGWRRWPCPRKNGPPKRRPSQVLREPATSVVGAESARQQEQASGSVNWGQTQCHTAASVTNGCLQDRFLQPAVLLCPGRV